MINPTVVGASMKRVIQTGVLLTLTISVAVFSWIWFGPARNNSSRVHLLILASASDNPAVSEPAKRKIELMGAAIVPILLDTIRKGRPKASGDPDDFEIDMILDLEDGVVNDERLAAAGAFRLVAPKIRNETIPQLAILLTNPPTSDRAAFALTFMGSNAVPIFLNALRNESPSVQMCALKGLGRLGYEAETAVQDVLSILNNEQDPEFQRESIRALVNINARPELVVPQLVKRFYRQNEMTKRDQLTLNLRVVKALGRFGTNATLALPELENALSKQEGYARKIVEETIRSISTGSENEAFGDSLFYHSD